jgi:hypothetical protein
VVQGNIEGMLRHREARDRNLRRHSVNHARRRADATSR